MVPNFLNRSRKKSGCLYCFFVFWIWIPVLAHWQAAVSEGGSSWRELTSSLFLFVQLLVLLHVGDWDFFFFLVNCEFLSLVNTDLPIAVCDLICEYMLYRFLLLPSSAFSVVFVLLLGCCFLPTIRSNSARSTKKIRPSVSFISCTNIFWTVFAWWIVFCLSCLSFLSKICFFCGSCFFVFFCYCFPLFDLVLLFILICFFPRERQLSLDILVGLRRSKLGNKSQRQN